MTMTDRRSTASGDMPEGRMARRGARAAAAAVALVLALVLSACAGLPTSGPVNAGQPIAEDEAGGDLVFLPDAPAKDATPQQIVEGFIAAGSGPRDNWAIAHLYLAPAFSEEWDPRAVVTVYDPGERRLAEITPDQFVLTVTPTAFVDSTGEMSATGDSSQLDMSFALAQQADGQWRITQAPQGIILDQNRFKTVFGSYSLQFFDPTWTYLVPDERWFPRQYAATRIAAELVNGGPSPWLLGAVATAFTDVARLATLSVPQKLGVAAVSLQDGARSLDRTVLDRMQTQLEASLAQARIDQVDMLVNEQVLPAEALTVRQTRVDTNPLVRTADDFGFLSGGTVEEIPGLSQALLQVSATDIEVDADRSLAAVRDSSGAVLRVDAEGADRVDERPGLLPPSVDASGYVWSVPQSTPGGVYAYGPDGAQIAIGGGWAGASQVLAQRVSRDGTRLAAVVRDGDRFALWVSGIVRDRSGAPTGLGEKRVLAVLGAGVTALTWTGSTSLAFATTVQGDPYLVTQEVGGFSSSQRVVPGVTAIAGGTQSGGVRVRDGAGELYAPRGSNWQQFASGIVVLAVQQGSPG